MEPLIMQDGDGWAYHAPKGSPLYEEGTRQLLALFGLEA